MFIQIGRRHDKSALLNIKGVRNENHVTEDGYKGFKVPAEKLCKQLKIDKVR
jgi:hypothetical protein